MESESKPQNIKAWQMSEFDNLELLCTQAIHYTCSCHSHETYSIGVIEDGVRGNYYRGSTHLAPPHSIILINPGEVHTGYSAHDLPLTYRMIYPSSRLMQQIAVDMGAKGIVDLKELVVQHELLAKKIYSLHYALEQPQSALKQEALLVETLSAVIADCADVKVYLPEAGREQYIVNRVKEYLQDNFSSNISLEQLVELTNLNRFYLIRLFRNAVGLPPYTYLIQIRVERAKQLLARGKSISEVALAVGMSDQSHLTRYFKRIVGTTPGSYRNMSTSFKTDRD